ncbi:DUF983 domain-containing protein [Xanthobacter sp. KR7-65]|uniref:DUF983 domain-containing protein n=1 Tax=Xanthobacter sp. KR7-65 TaxID=3156612 RepID=UPI0032B43725
MTTPTSMTVTKKLGQADGIIAEAPAAPLPARPVQGALMRGARCLCPACGAGSLFSSYLKVTPFCATCGEELYHHRADDAPPYAVIFAVGHIVVPLMVLVEEMFRPDVWVHLVLWLPLTLILSLVLLPPLKAMLVNLQWALRMHGFDPLSAEREAPPEGVVRPVVRAVRPTR